MSHKASRAHTVPAGSRQAKKAANRARKHRLCAESQELSASKEPTGPESTQAEGHLPGPGPSLV